MRACWPSFTFEAHDEPPDPTSSSSSLSHAPLARPVPTLTLPLRVRPMPRAQGSLARLCWRRLSYWPSADVRYRARIENWRHSEADGSENDCCGKDSLLITSGKRRVSHNTAEREGNAVGENFVVSAGRHGPVRWAGLAKAALNHASQLWGPGLCQVSGTWP